MRKITIVCSDSDAKIIRMALDGAYQSYQEETCNDHAPKKKHFAYVGGMRNKLISSKDLIEKLMAGKNRIFTRQDLLEMAKDQYRFANNTTKNMISRALKAKVIEQVAVGKYQWISKK